MKSCHLEYYLQWTHQLLSTHGTHISKDTVPYQESLRTLLRSITTHDKAILKKTEENQFLLKFLTAQIDSDVVDNMDDVDVQVEFEVGSTTEEENDEVNDTSINIDDSYKAQGSKRHLNNFEQIHDDGNMNANSIIFNNNNNKKKNKKHKKKKLSSNI
jgi:hypothetical protein